MQTIRTEKTSKGLKAIIVLAVLIELGSASLAWYGWGGPLALYAGYGAGAGALLWAGARLAAWWQYG